MIRESPNTLNRSNETAHSYRPMGCKNPHSVRLNLTCGSGSGGLTSTAKFCVKGMGLGGRDVSQSHDLPQPYSS